MNYSMRGEKPVKVIVCAYYNDHGNNPNPRHSLAVFWNAQNFYVVRLEGQLKENCPIDILHIKM